MSGPVSRTWTWASRDAGANAIRSTAPSPRSHPATRCVRVPPIRDVGSCWTKQARWSVTSRRVFGRRTGCSAAHPPCLPLWVGAANPQSPSTGTPSSATPGKWWCPNWCSSPTDRKTGQVGSLSISPTLFLPEAQDISPLDLRAPVSSSGRCNEPPRRPPPTSEAIELDCAGVDLKRSRIEPERLFSLWWIAPPVLFRAAARNVGVYCALLEKGAAAQARGPPAGTGRSNLLTDRGG